MPKKNPTPAPSKQDPFKDFDTGAETIITELLKGAWQTVRAAGHLARAVLHVLRYDWPYVLGYAVLVAIVRFAFGVVDVSHHPPISFLLVAVVAFLAAAAIRRGTTTTGHSHLEQQVEGVIAAALKAGPTDREPEVKITRGAQGKIKNIEVNHLPYHVDNDARQAVERLWHARVPAPAGTTDWQFKWDLHHNLMQVTPKSIETLPDRVPLKVHDAPNGLALRLGQAINAAGDAPEWVWWDPDAADPHLLSTGPTRSGKSVLLRVLLAQALAGGWVVIIADPKGVDYRWADGLPGIRRASGERAFEAIDWAREEMARRQNWMENHAPRTAANLGESPNNPFMPCLVIIDETAELLELDGDAEDAKEARARREQTRKSLGSLARRSRFVSIVMCVATQRADATIIPVETRGNLGTRVLTGEGEPGHKQMAFGTQQIPRLRAGYPQGRGRVMVGGGMPREMQVPWISTEDILAAYLPPDERDDTGPEPSAPAPSPTSPTEAAPAPDGDSEIVPPPPALTEYSDEPEEPDDREEPFDAPHPAASDPPTPPRLIEVDELVPPPPEPDDDE